ncbi:hypothetical protein X801_01550, partial [Opisthorchis viverrini]
MFIYKSVALDCIQKKMIYGEFLHVEPHRKSAVRSNNVMSHVGHTNTHTDTEQTGSLPPTERTYTRTDTTDHSALAFQKPGYLHVRKLTDTTPTTVGPEQFSPTQIGQQTHQQQLQHQLQTKRGFIETPVEETEHLHRKHLIHKNVLNKPAGTGSSKVTQKITPSSADQRPNVEGSVTEYKRLRTPKFGASSSGKSDVSRDSSGRSKLSDHKGSWIASTGHPSGNIYHQSPSESTTNTTSDSQEQERHYPPAELSQGVTTSGKPANDKCNHA